MKNVKVLLLITGLLVLLSGGCSKPKTPVSMHLAAAASLQDVLNEVVAGYTRSHPAFHATLNFGASGALAKQIENGVPTDIFISASPEWMDYLREKKVIDAGSVRDLTANRLVFVGKEDKTVAGIADVVKLNRIALGNPKSVPAGEYARQALTNARVFPAVENKLIMARDVREALLYAKRGEVDGAFVYQTDALQEKEVRILFTVPQDLTTPITYPIGLTASGMKNPAVGDFVAYLESPQAQTVFEKFGFITSSTKTTSVSRHAGFFLCFQ